MLRLKNDVVRAKIEAAGVSATQFARKYGFPQTSLASWLTGARNPKRATIERMAEIFGCDMADICKIVIDTEQLRLADGQLDELRSYWTYLTQEQRDSLLNFVRTIAREKIEQQTGQDRQ